MEIKQLALGEMLEIVVPLSYTIAFIVAYYGPNATLIRGVKNNYWGNRVVFNLGDVLETELLLFSVDFGCLITTTIALWYFCKINMLKQFCWELKKYWFLIAAVAGALITNVSINLNLNVS